MPFVNTTFYLNKKKKLVWQQAKKEKEFAFDSVIFLCQRIRSLLCIKWNHVLNVLVLDVIFFNKPYKQWTTDQKKITYLADVTEIVLSRSDLLWPNLWYSKWIFFFFYSLYTIKIIKTFSKKIHLLIYRLSKQFNWF